MQTARAGIQAQRQACTREISRKLQSKKKPKQIGTSRTGEQEKQHQLDLETLEVRAANFFFPSFFPFLLTFH